MGFFSKIKRNKEEYNELKEKFEQLERDYAISQNKYYELNNTIEQLQKKENEIKKSIDKKSLEYVDQLEGLEFEEYISQLLLKLGYIEVEKTKASGDFGIDILAEKDFITYAIQCKLYTNKLGIESVQEAYAGKKHYDRNVAIVITNSFFTESAISLAKDTGVILWDRLVLDSMLRKINGTFMEKNKTEDFCEEDDPLYNEVVQFVLETQKASASLLQRKFKLGYNRAARIMDLLEERGIVGPQNGSNPREVLIKID